MALQIESRGEIRIVTIDRPEALNALNAATLDEFGDVLASVEASRPRALIITGAGDRAFCSGADVKELFARSQAARVVASRGGHAIFRRLESLQCPTIALINGVALGGGLELALACTFRIATPNAKLGLPEVKLGLIPSYGGTQRLPRLVGEARALELILTGEPITAQTAYAIGLVNQIAEAQALEKAISFAEQFTKYSRRTVELALAAIKDAQPAQTNAGFAHEIAMARRVFSTRDADEGMRAFLEKRPPEFNDN